MSFKSKICKHIILILFFSVVSVYGFAEDWCIYLGSFKKFTNAEKRQELLQKNDIITEITHYNAPDGVIYYRLRWEEHLPNMKSAELHKVMLSYLPIIKKERIDDIWFERLDKTVTNRVLTVKDIETGNPVANADIIIDECWSIRTDAHGNADIPIEVADGEHSVAVEKVDSNYLKTETSLIIQSGNLISGDEVDLLKRNRSIIINDSDTGKPVENAEIAIDNRRWVIRTNQLGVAELPDELDDGEHTFVIGNDSDGYVETERVFSILSGCLSSANQVSIPKAVDYERIKIILNWGEEPWDLDSHIWSGDNHVYFSNMEAGNLSLDYDDTNSYGPETITIKSPSAEDVYEYYVKNYTDEDIPDSNRLSLSEAHIQIFFNNEFKGEYKVIPNQDGIWWHVFDIKNGYDIIVRDEVLQYISK
jgi:hypothetical protein